MLFEKFFVAFMSLSKCRFLVNLALSRTLSLSVQKETEIAERNLTRKYMSL